MLQDYDTLVVPIHLELMKTFLVR